MGNCCEKTFGDQTYLPLNKRLIRFGEENTDPDLLEKFNNTTLWMFTFIDSTKLCIECEQKFLVMLNWVQQFGLLKNPVNNVKWVVEDDMLNNLICRDIGIEKSPTHLLCDKMGNILDIVVGFPDEKWLEKYILPLVTSDLIKDV